MAVTTEQVAAIYVATFNRAPDAAGLAYWVNDSFGGNPTIEQIAASFFDSPEAQAMYTAEMTTVAKVQMAYTNLFGRTVAADDAGVAYWVGELEAGHFTQAEMLLALQNGALGDDATVLANKTEAGLYYADAGMTGTDFDLSGITADTATVTAAQAAIDAIVENAAFVANLETLAAANSALADFLADNPTTAADLTTAQTTYDSLTGGTVATDSAELKAALLAAAEIANADALTAAQTAVADAEADVAAVPGLTAAIAAATAATDASDAADHTAATAAIALDSAEATYNLDAVSAVTIGAGTVVTVANAAGVDLIVTVDGSLVLNPDVDADPLTDDAITEEAYPGITALLNAAIANNAAITAATNAATAEAAAIALVDRLDTSDATEAAALAAMGAAMLQVTPANADYPTAAEVEQEITTLEAGILSLDSDIGSIVYGADDAATEAVHNALTAAAVTAEYITAAQKALIDAEFADTLVLGDGSDLATAISASQAQLALDNNALTFQGIIDAYDTAFASGVNPLSDALDTANGLVDTAQTAIDDLADAVTALSDAEAAVAAQTVLEDAVDAAETAFTDAGMVVPVELSVDKVATANSDTFTAITEDVAVAIANFGLLGEDKIYIGTDYTYNDGVYATDGVNTVLEAFLSDVGGNATITLENETFSSSTDATETVITLTGVALADITIADGFITLV